MLDLTKKFSTEIQEAVKNEKLVKIPGFPGNDKEMKYAFVTPKMAEIYKQRENKNLPDFVVVVIGMHHIAECVGSEIRLIKNTDSVLTQWEN